MSDLRYEVISIAKIIPTPDNPRVIKKGSQEMKDLAASIKAHGVIEPVLCRPHPDKKGMLDLRAGHRRIVAATMAKLKEIPVVIRDMDDKEALEVTIVENLQRENLSPMEEAIGLDSMLQQGWTAKDAAKQLGRDAMWISRRRQLVNLSPAWKKALKKDGPATHWSVEHLQLIARLSENQQDKLLHDLENNYIVEGWRIDALREHLAKSFNLISCAPWGVKSCADCVNRSDRQPELFDDEDLPREVKRGKSGASCLNPACWKEYENKFITARVAELYEEYGKNLILVGESKACGKATKLHQVEACKKSDNDARPCVGVDSEEKNFGKLTWGKKLNQSSSTSTAKKTKKPPKQQQIDHLQEAVEARMEELGEDNSDLPEVRLEDVLAFTIHTFLNYSEYPYNYAADGWKVLQKLRKMTTAELSGILLRGVAQEFLMGSEPSPQAVEVCSRLFGLDVDSLKKEALELFPDIDA